MLPGSLETYSRNHSCQVLAFASSTTSRITRQPFWRMFAIASGPRS